ncbi:hypothetical protein B0H12DRAFT_1068688 [Mycena haematopus]|nr:hypothetical protein B0H12DRAFT_1068688 [Mycena haematopus]
MSEIWTVSGKAGRRREQRKWAGDDVKEDLAIVAWTEVTRAESRSQQAQPQQSLRFDFGGQATILVGEDTDTLEASESSNGEVLVLEVKRCRHFTLWPMTNQEKDGIVQLNLALFDDALAIFTSANFLSMSVERSHSSTQDASRLARRLEDFDLSYTQPLNHGSQQSCFQMPSKLFFTHSGKFRRRRTRLSSTDDMGRAKAYFGSPLQNRKVVPTVTSRPPARGHAQAQKKTFLATATADLMGDARINPACTACNRADGARQACGAAMRAAGWAAMRVWWKSGRGRGRRMASIRLDNSRAMTEGRLGVMHACSALGVFCLSSRKDGASGAGLACFCATSKGPGVPRRYPETREEVEEEVKELKGNGQGVECV